MKITIVQGAFFPVPAVMGGAVEKVWDALGKEFSKRKHSVVHISRRHGILPIEECINGVHHVRVASVDSPQSPIKNKLLDLLYSLRVLRSLPPADVLVTNTFWLPMIVRNGAYGKVYVHVARYPKGQMRFYHGASRIQTVANSVAKAIICEAPRLRSRIKVIPYPVIPPKIPSETCMFGESRGKVILFVGRIHPEKGIELLIRAFQMLPPQYAEHWKLVIVGSADVKYGGGGGAYMKSLARLGKQTLQSIEWHGPEFCPDALLKLYRWASLFVYPSLAERGETFGLAPLEAMSNGCPPLVSNLDCFQEYLRDGENGYIFDHRHSEPEKQLASTIVSCIRDEMELAKMGQQAYLTSLHYSIEKICTAFIEDFQTLVVRERPSSRVF